MFCVLVKFVCLFCFSFMCCLSWLLISFKCVMKQSFEQQRGLCLRPSPRSATRLRTPTKRKDTKLFNSLSRILAARSVCTVFCFAAFHVTRLEDWRCRESLLFWCGLFDEPVICQALACSGLKYMEEEQKKKKDCLVAELNF